MTKNWTQTLPLAWILRALNMDDERLSTHYPLDSYEWDGKTTSFNIFTTGILNNFIKVIEFEDTLALENN
jgi:hypothetical protein